MRVGLALRSGERLRIGRRLEIGRTILAPARNAADSLRRIESFHWRRAQKGAVTRRNRQKEAALCAHLNYFAPLRETVLDAALHWCAVVAACAHQQLGLVSRWLGAHLPLMNTFAAGALSFPWTVSLSLWPSWQLAARVHEPPST